MFYRLNVDGTLFDFVFNAFPYMANHAGSRRSVVNPGTKLLRRPVEVTQYWSSRSGFGACFL